MNYLLEGQETERLRFRLLKPSDFDTWLSLFAEADVARFLGMHNIASPFDQCRRWFDNAEKRQQKELGGMNVLVEKNSGELIGQCGLLVQKVEEKQELEVAYSILPRYWNNGYAREAALRCRDYAFENDFAESLISIIHIENVRSEKVALKNGMKKIKQIEFSGIPVNVFRISKLEWLDIKSL